MVVLVQTDPATIIVSSVVDDHVQKTLREYGRHACTYACTCMFHAHVIHMHVASKGEQLNTSLAGNMCKIEILPSSDFSEYPHMYTPTLWSSP